MCEALKQILHSDLGLLLLVYFANALLTGLYKLLYFMHQKFKWSGWGYAESVTAFLLTGLSWVMANHRHPPDKPEVEIKK